MTNTGNLEMIADSRMLKYKNNFCCFELPLYFCASHGNFEALFVLSVDTETEIISRYYLYYLIFLFLISLVVEHIKITTIYINYNF